MLQQYASPTEPKYVEAFKPFANEVESKSGGRIKIDIFMGQEYAKARDFFDVVEGGGADIGWMPMSYATGRFPLSGIMQLPFATTTSADATDTFMKLLKTGLLDGEFNTVKLLAADGSSPYEIFSVEKQIRTPADIKGLKFRVSGGLHVKIFETWGAVPVTVSGPELYTALATGVCDGTQITFGSAPGYNLHEITEHMTQIDCSNSTHIAFMNLDTWNKLPPDLQKIVEEAGAEIAVNIAKVYDGQSDDAVSDYQEKGVKLYVPTEEEKELWREPLVPIWEDWVSSMEKQGLPGQQVYDAFVKILEAKGIQPLTK
ncbi:TRAP transporter substrate-binding protein [Chloroflexota bacterium]